MMHETEPQPTRPEEVEYVGAPTEYADAEEVPDWVATGAKAVVAIPAVLAALSVIQVALLVAFLVCIASFVCLVLVF
jgi:hypothetical protein